MKARMRAFLKTTAIVIASLLLAFGLGEVYLRQEFKEPAHRFVLPPLYEATYTPTAEGTPGVVGSSFQFRTNRWGLRGGDIPTDGGPVVYVMGGSTAIDVWLAEAWPDRLQRMLRQQPGLDKAIVINVSKWGLSTHHNLLHFQEVVPYLPKHPDVVVILAGANDMQRVLKTSYPDVITPDFDLRVAYHYIAPPDTAWYTSFGLYRLYKRLAEVRQKLQTGPLLGGGGDVLLPARRCRQAAHDEDLVDELPPLEAGLADYRRNLEALIGHAGRYKADVVFATQPTLWQKNMRDAEKRILLSGGLATFAEWHECKNVRYYSPVAQQHALGAFNDVMRSVCRNNGRACVDLERIIPKEAKYYYDDMHYTEAGSEAVAAAVLPQVVEALRRRGQPNQQTVRP